MIVSWNWLKDYLGDTTLTAAEAAELLGAHAFEIEDIQQVGDDIVIDVDVLPNRSSDCLSHRGIARELATITGVQLANDPLQQKVELPSTDLIDITIEDSADCPRFSASLIEGIEVKESPAWLKERLEAIGQRPINSVVDATNYVMFAIGQPIHAYDAELFPQVDGKWQFEVRKAKEGEVVSLLAEGGKDEDRDVELKGTELLIVDGSSNTPIGLAGVKGGRFAGVHVGTTKIIVEAAHFHPTLTRKTARRLGIVIDASKRFENEPSRELIPFTQAEITKLITDIAGGTVTGVTDTYLEEIVPIPVVVTEAKTNALLGLTLSKEEIKDILIRTGSTVEETDQGFAATGPWDRTDLHIEEDFIEEIGRIYGYDHVVSVPPEPRALLELNKRHFYSEVVRQTLMQLGFSEIITSSFRKKDKIQLQNALASDKSYLRSALAKNIAEALDKNAGFTDLLGTPDTRVFEIGTVFYKNDETVTEHLSVALGVRLKQSGYSGKEDRLCDEALSALSGALGVPFKAAAQGGSKTVEEEGGVYTYTQGVAEINFTEVLESLPEPAGYEQVTVKEEISYKPFSVYQHMSRDIALWVTEGTTVADVEAILNEHAGDLRVRTTLFDEFAKDGRQSYAFRLVFQSLERTLTDDEVNIVMEHISSVVAEKGWEVR